MVRDGDDPHLIKDPMLRALKRYRRSRINTAGWRHNLQIDPFERQERTAASRCLAISGMGPTAADSDRRSLRPVNVQIVVDFANAELAILHSHR